MAGITESDEYRVYCKFRVTEEVRELDALVFEEETPEEVWESKRDKGLFTIIVMEMCGEYDTVGFLSVYNTDESTLHIWKTGVHPGHTEKGLFKRMIKKVFDYARKHNKDITIGTDPARFPVMHSILERHTCERFDRPVEAGKQKKEGYVYYKWKKGSY